MSNLKSQKRNCPSELYLEYLCLDRGLGEDKKRTQIHLQQCNQCREVVDELDTFYSIFLQEISKPVTNKTLDFAKKLAASHVKYGLLICKPVPEKNSDRGHAYQSKILFSANGESGKKKLADYDLYSISSADIAIRIITDSAGDNASIHLWNKTATEFDNWVLSIPGFSDEIHFNKAGSATIPFINIEKLRNKRLFFQPTLSNISKEERFYSIRSAIFY